MQLRHCWQRPRLSPFAVSPGPNIMPLWRDGEGRCPRIATLSIWPNKSLPANGDSILSWRSQRIVEKAGEYAEAFALRGYEVVQLAAAQEAMIQTDLPLTFACFDRRLNLAAKLLNMKIIQL